jgi:hypothetical protein
MYVPFILVIIYYCTEMHAMPLGEVVQHILSSYFVFFFGG